MPLWAWLLIFAAIFWVIGWGLVALVLVIAAGVAALVAYAPRR